MNERAKHITMAVLITGGLVGAGLTNDSWRSASAALPSEPVLTAALEAAAELAGVEHDETEAAEPGLPPLAENFAEIQREAMERIGYVPQGGMPAGMEGSTASRTQRFDAADVFPVDPVTLMTPHGKVRLTGVASVGAKDECRGAFDAAFSCHEWAMEGMQVLLAHAGSLRCLVAESEVATAIEAEAGEVEVSTAMCQANIGGDWIDLGDWSVRNGLNIAELDGPLIPVQGEARESGKGIWSASWRPEGAPRIAPYSAHAPEFDLVDDLPPL